MTRARQAAAAGGPLSAASATAKDHRRAVPLLEWIIGGLGSALVGCAIAYLVVHSFARDQNPPDIRLVAERVLDLQNGYLVQFRALNEGSAAAAQVTIEGELAASDGSTEVSEVVFDYLPPRSDRAGGLLFQRDPRAGALSLRAMGYAKP